MDRPILDDVTWRVVWEAQASDESRRRSRVELALRVLLALAMVVALIAL